MMAIVRLDIVPYARTIDRALAVHLSRLRHERNVMKRDDARQRPVMLPIASHEGFSVIGIDEAQIKRRQRANLPDDIGRGAIAKENMRVIAVDPQGGVTLD